MQISSSPQPLSSTNEIKSVDPAKQIDSVPPGFFNSYIKPFIELLKHKIGGWIHSVKSVFRHSSTVAEITEVKQPLFLRTAGNTCYLACVLNLLFSQKEVRERLYQLDFSKNKKEKQFIRALKKLLAENRETSQGKSLGSVRKALFASEANQAEFPPPHSDNYASELGTQKDAASVLEVLSQLFDYKIVTQKTWSTESVGILKELPPESLCVLQLELIGEFKKNYLLDLFNSCFENEKMNISEVREQNHQALKDPDIKLGKTEIDSSSKEKLDSEVSVVNQQIKFVSLPSILPIQVKRFICDKQGSRKLNPPLILPKDGMIDVSKWVDSKSTACDSTNYELMGYVVHSGGLHGGHYIARVKIEDQFFECNDMAEPPFKSISREQFYQEQQAYLLLFKQHPNYDCPLSSSQKFKGME